MVGIAGAGVELKNKDNIKAINCCVTYFSKYILAK